MQPSLAVVCVTHDNIHDPIPLIFFVLVARGLWFALRVQLYISIWWLCIGIISSASKHFARCFILLLSHIAAVYSIHIVYCICSLHNSWLCCTHVSTLDLNSTLCCFFLFPFLPFFLFLLVWAKDTIFFAPPLQHVLQNIKHVKKNRSSLILFFFLLPFSLLFHVLR